MRPRVLFVSRTRYRLPLDEGLERKFGAPQAAMDVPVLATAAPGSPTGDGVFALVPPRQPRALDGAAFWLTLPLRVARALRRVRPDAVVTQSPYEAAAVAIARRLTRRHVPIVLEVHGDWRSSTRLYGSPHRKLLGPLGDTVARASFRRADAVRTVSAFTARLAREQGVEPAAVFRTFTDLTEFLARPCAPLPERPQALFVGVLERYKNVDGLVEAWRRAAPRVPEATIRIVGKGTLAPLVERLVAEHPEQTSWTPALTGPEVARELDASTMLVLPSRSEGLPRVVVEALARCRPVLGSRAGGIPDAIADGENGLLVEPEDTAALADALVRMLSDRELAERLAAAARPSAERWLASPEEYAEQLLALVERVVEPRTDA